MAVCSYHVTYVFQSESTLYSWRNANELFGWNKCDICCSHLISIVLEGKMERGTEAALPLVLCGEIESVVTRGSWSDEKEDLGSRCKLFLIWCDRCSWYGVIGVLEMVWWVFLMWCGRWFMIVSFKN